MNKLVRILIVEDQAVVAQDLRQRLESLGYDVVGTASRATEALELAALQRPDVVLMDIQLPGGTDGIAAAIALRERQRTPVIFLTAHAEEETLDRAKAADPAGYILKPIEDRALRVAIEVAVHNHAMESRLRASEERLRLVLDATHEGVWDWNIATGMVESSPQWIRGLGLEREGFRMTGDEWAALVHPEDLPGTRQSLRDHLEGRAPIWDWQNRVRHQNGEYLFTHNRGSVVERDQAGTPLRMLGTSTDITFSKRTQQLLEARVRLSEAASNRPLDELLRLTLDEAEAITNSNIGFLHFVAKDQQTLMLQVWSTNTTERMCRASAMPRQYPLSEAGVWADCLRTGATVIHNDYAHLEGRHGLPPGHAVVEREIVVPVRRGETIVALLGVGNKRTPYDSRDEELVSQLANLAWDIVLAKKAEDALRGSESSYRGLFNTIPLGVFINDAEVRCIDVNESGIALYGYTREDLLGRTPDFLAAPGRNDLEALSRRVRLALAGEPQQFEFWGLRKNGEVFPQDVRLCRGTHFGREALVAIVTNTTEARRLEEQLRQAQRLEAIGRLAGGVAHDFNNILAAMTLQIGLLQLNLAGDPQSLADLGELGQLAERAATLTRQLLMFGRRAMLRPQTLQLNGLVAEVTSTVRRLLGEGIVVDFEPAADLAPIHADPGMLQQVILNLCVNARDAMPTGGRLDLRTVRRVLDAGNLAHPDARPGEFACLIVHDSGRGMDATTLQRIFEPFFTSKEFGKGTGLGLSSVYGVVQQHGGWVEVESALGQGTTFRIFLPASARAVAAPPRPPAPGPTRGQEQSAPPDAPGS